MCGQIHKEGKVSSKKQKKKLSFLPGEEKTFTFTFIHFDFLCISKKKVTPCVLLLIVFMCLCVSARTDFQTFSLLINGITNNKSPQIYLLNPRILFHIFIYIRREEIDMTWESSRNS